MRAYSRSLVDCLDCRSTSVCLDLTCGTGFVTAELAQRSNASVVGVDASGGMLEAARAKHGERCSFVQGDVLHYLRRCPRNCYDIVTCAWGLGYTRPWGVVREVARILRPGGKFAVIDNSLFSLSSVLWTSVLAFAEYPDALVHVMRVHFLPGSWALATLMRAAGLAVLSAWSGVHTHEVPNGQAALSRLTATGAAAGFEFAVDDSKRDAVLARFAEILQRRGDRQGGIRIKHHYLAAVGQKR